MDPDSRLSIVIIIISFIASQFFALTETAIASVSRTRMKVAEERGDVRAKRVLRVLDSFDEAITTILIGTNIAHILAASLVTVLVTRMFHLSGAALSWVSLSTFLFTIVMFFLGEMLPKSIGKKANENCSLACSGILLVLMKIFWPLSKLLSLIGNLTSKLFRAEEEQTVTEEELYDIIEDMEEKGSIDEEQSELISSALQFADVTANSILTPRVDVSAFDVSDTPEEILSFVKAQTHSRVLAYEKTVDSVVGVLQIRKYLKEYLKTGVLPDVRAMLDPVFFAPQSMEISELLSEMTKRKLNMAVVTDSFGGTLGVVTVEDILEEIVGEIWDEDDEIREPIVELSDHTFLARGDETVNDVFDFIGFEEPEEENRDRFMNLFVSDWVYEQFTLIPKTGDSFRYGNLLVTVTEMDKNRINRVQVEVLPEDEGSEEVPEESEVPEASSEGNAPSGPDGSGEGGER